MPLSCGSSSPLPPRSRLAIFCRFVDRPHWKRKIAHIEIAHIVQKITKKKIHKIKRKFWETWKMTSHKNHQQEIQVRFELCFIFSCLVKIFDIMEAGQENGNQLGDIHSVVALMYIFIVFCFVCTRFIIIKWQTYIQHPYRWKCKMPDRLCILFLTQLNQNKQWFEYVREYVVCECECLLFFFGFYLKTG